MDIVSLLIGMKLSGNKNSGDASNASYEYFEKEFEAVSQQMIVTHEMEKIPDIIFCQKVGSPAVDESFFWIGYSKAMLEKLGGGYLCKVSVLFSNGSVASITSNSGIETSGESVYENYGGIRNFTSNQFTIGGSQNGLVAGNKYLYTAICGLT